MIRVAVFYEDDGHRSLITPLVRRIAAEEGVQVSVDERNATGGIPAALAKLRQYGRDLQRGLDYHEVLVIAIDGNCGTYSSRRDQVADLVGEEYAGCLVVAVPDPHVERWYLAAPRALQQAAGLTQTPPLPPPDKCDHQLQASPARSVRHRGGPSSPGRLRVRPRPSERTGVDNALPARPLPRTVRRRPPISPPSDGCRTAAPRPRSVREDPVSRHELPSRIDDLHRHLLDPEAPAVQPHRLGGHAPSPPCRSR